MHYHAFSFAIDKPEGSIDCSMGRPTGGSDNADG
jgi:hypothetical protein